jgi:hypothetical protein
MAGSKSGPQWPHPSVRSHSPQNGARLLREKDGPNAFRRTLAATCVPVPAGDLVDQGANRLGDAPPEKQGRPLPQLAGGKNLRPIAHCAAGVHPHANANRPHAVISAFALVGHAIKVRRRTPLVRAMRRSAK